MSVSEAIIKRYLRKHGVTDAKVFEKVASGFELLKPVYEQLIEPRDRLFQFIRNPQFTYPAMRTGEWFCLAGASMDAVGIFSGLSGRSLAEFTVSIPVMALEGTAGPMARDWGWALGGTGGATQIYLPQQLLFALVGKGMHSSGRAE